MGKLIDGEWHDVWYSTAKTGGAFVRPDTSFRGSIHPDGPHPPAKGRYHLYVSLACPWACRVLIARALKGLESVLPVSQVEALMLSHGWEFSADRPDALFGSDHLHQVYTRANPHYTGRVTVPVLYDTVADTIVNNESSELLRILDSAFGDWANSELQLYPEPLRDEIDAINADVYPHLNNGVYRAGFAQQQSAYNAAVRDVFGCLDRLEARLSDGRPWLCGDALTEADVRAFTTLVRFDPIYHGHFKCNLRMLRDYSALSAFVRRLYALPGVAPTVDLDYARLHYYGSHRTINPTGIVPIGPPSPI